MKKKIRDDFYKHWPGIKLNSFAFHTKMIYLNNLAFCIQRPTTENNFFIGMWWMWALKLNSYFRLALASMRTSNLHLQQFYDQQMYAINSYLNNCITKNPEVHVVCTVFCLSS